MKFTTPSIHNLASQFLSLYPTVNLLSMHWNIMWCFDAEANLTSPDFNDPNADVVVDNDALVFLA